MSARAKREGVHQLTIVTHRTHPAPFTLLLDLYVSLVPQNDVRIAHLGREATFIVHQ
jgi:hypothetical protein